MLKRITIGVCLLLLAWLSVPAWARNTRGDVLLAKAQIEEEKGTAQSLDTALELVWQALATDPSDIEYQLAFARIRAFAAQKHIHNGNLLLNAQKHAEALAEFEKAAAIDPAPSVALQEIRKQKQIQEQLKSRPGLTYEDVAGSPLAQADKRVAAQFQSLKPLPRLEVKLATPLPKLRVNGLSSGDVFTTLGNLAGIKVLFDPDYQGQSLGRNQMLDFSGLSLEEALDSLALITKSFWKPIQRDTILVSGEDPGKRATYDDQVTKVLYLTNAPAAPEVQNIANTVKTVTDIKKLLVHPEQNAIVLRTDPARAALAEKVVRDLDKPKAEIIIDVLILSVSKDWVRDLGTLLALSPANAALTFAPRASIGGQPATSSSGPTIPLSSLHRIQAGDYAVTLPGTALNALLQVRGTKILDKAQLRTIEGQKSTLKIGQKVPYATGSFAPGAVGGSVSALVNTQFQFFDVGLNIDVTAKVHDPDEVSLHIESDHSAVADYTNLGGVVQPVISQRRRVADVRVKEGEVNFWDIVTSRQSIRTTTGMPGLSQIPVIGRIFTNEHKEETEDQLLHLLIPHIVRSADIREINVESVPSGSDQVVRLAFAGAARPEGTPASEIVDVEKQAVPPPPAAPPAPAAGTGQPAKVAIPTTPLVLELTPAPVNAAMGSQFTLELKVDNGGDAIGSGSVGLDFDPASIVLTSAVTGPVLGGSAVPLQTSSTPSGATILLNRAGAGSGPSGAVAVLTFQTKSPGPTLLSVSDVKLKTADSNSIPASGGRTIEVNIK